MIGTRKIYSKFMFLVLQLLIRIYFNTLPLYRLKEAPEFEKELEDLVPMIKQWEKEE